MSLICTLNRPGDAILIGPDIRLTLLRSGRHPKLAVEAPPEVRIERHHVTVPPKLPD